MNKVEEEMKQKKGENEKNERKTEMKMRNGKGIFLINLMTFNI